MTDAKPAAGLWRLLLLLVGNVALALGPWLVRLADTGPVAAGWWRLTLALPVILIFAFREKRGASFGMSGLGAAGVWMAIGAGVFFALDLASWHLGIERTRLGNASLFGNAGSVIIVVFALVSAGRRPRIAELLAVGCALGGAGLLMGGSLEIGTRYLVGDLFCLLAGLFYAFYILMLRHIRGRLGSWSLLGLSSLAGAPVMIAIALLMGETIWPGDWTPVLALALSSQVLGQGALVYSLGWFRPLVIGLALLTQPAISSLAGWLAFDETLSTLDFVGMVLMATALVMARVAEPRAVKGPKPEPV
ncbi:DMT family transporter [Croceicoccus naphthovorans]|uniref:Permease n=1 Tax=Croceicoccus naphthovorans TaxID=1348774 RepID=A0A0G3XBR1_9SPHN|nr:DMT family transporter [Croceicoccus naphthovorans]AKM09015.1 permease [Croceicoccus naphthovorans]MBB3989165.1 drug/metabolite transporter (DMT)-like permease [Croceicoccus naphthovorans]